MKKATRKLLQSLRARARAAGRKGHAATAGRLRKVAGKTEELAK